MHRLAVVVMLLLALVAPVTVRSADAAETEQPLVVVVVGDSGGSLAGHPGAIGCPGGRPDPIFGCDGPVELEGYTPPFHPPSLEYFPGYHADGLVVADLAQRGIDAVAWPRAVWGSRTAAWTQPDEPVCDPTGQHCGKSPGEVAVELAALRAAGYPVLIWFSTGVGAVADVVDGSAPPVAWHDTNTWDQRFEAEQQKVRDAIAVLRSFAPDVPVVLPGYVNLNSRAPSVFFNAACGFLFRNQFQTPLTVSEWDQMLNPLLNGGGGPVWVGPWNLGSAHPEGVAGVLRSVADDDPSIAFGESALALRADAPSSPPWAPSPDSMIHRDCLHLRAAGSAGLVAHVLDVVLPELELSGD